MTRRKPRYRREEDAAANAAAEAAAASEGPRKRIDADLTQQAPHTSFGAVPLHYEDVAFRCVDCGREEVWTAEQQKWWYETAKGYLFSTAIHCHACRVARRENHGGTVRRSHKDRQDNPEDSSP